MKEVYIVSAVRTPVGSFCGSLANVSATKLGAAVIQAAIERIKITPSSVDEVFMGNVLQAGEGQAPAKQAAIYAGLGNYIPCTTVNKVCASGMKSIILATQTIAVGDNNIVVAGGMENMSQVPYYLPNARTGYRLGDGKLVDGLVYDGLINVYDKHHMGISAEVCAKEGSFSREDQDNYTIQSYKKSADAWNTGKFDAEVVPISVPQRKGDPIIFSKDEEYTNVKLDKIPTLNSVFQKDGTVTAANSSTLNDGASALILMSKEKMESLGLKPLAKVIGYADASEAPEWFPKAPAKTIPLALKKAGLQISDVDFFELNEAFAVVALYNMKKMGLKPEQVNVNGGAVSLGHPLGSSGARIVVSLINILKQNKGKYGVASICNGGGGASAIVIENL